MTSIVLKRGSSPKQTNTGMIFKILMILFLLFFTVLALLPFVWMLSASLKLDKDVFR